MQLHFSCSLTSGRLSTHRHALQLCPLADESPPAHAHQRTLCFSLCGSLCAAAGSFWRQGVRLVPGGAQLFQRQGEPAPLHLRRACVPRVPLRAPPVTTANSNRPAASPSFSPPAPRRRRIPGQQRRAAGLGHQSGQRVWQCRRHVGRAGQGLALCAGGLFASEVVVLHPGRPGQAEHRSAAQGCCSKPPRVKTLDCCPSSCV